MNTEMLRATRWDAPTIHQLIFSAGLIAFGLSQLIGEPLDLARLPHPAFLFNSATMFLALVAGTIGVWTAFYSSSNWSHGLRVVFCTFNLAFYCALSFVFASTFRVGTIVYPMVMLWAMWLLVRVVYDRRINVEIVKIIKKRSNA